MVWTVGPPSGSSNDNEQLDDAGSVRTRYNPCTYSPVYLSREALTRRPVHTVAPAIARRTKDISASTQP